MRDRYPDGHNVGLGMVYESSEEREITRLERRLKDVQNKLNEALKTIQFLEQKNEEK